MRTPMDRRKACVSASVLLISRENISLPAMAVNGVSGPRACAMPVEEAVWVGGGSWHQGPASSVTNQLFVLRGRQSDAEKARGRGSHREAGLDARKAQRVNFMTLAQLSLSPNC